MIIDKIVKRHLDKNGFIKVPKSWADDYKGLVDKKREADRVLRELGREYNTLLKEFASEKSVAWLKESLGELKYDVKSLNKEQLIDLYVETFSVLFEDDTDEEVK